MNAHSPTGPSVTASPHELQTALLQRAANGNRDAMATLVRLHMRSARQSLPMPAGTGAITTTDTTLAEIGTNGPTELVLTGSSPGVTDLLIQHGGQYSRWELHVVP